MIKESCGTLIFITGDTHGDKKRFSEVKGIRKGDTLIVCGDFGFIWNNTKAEKRTLAWTGKHKYNVAFVDGYHDNLEYINEYPIEEWNGGRVRRICGNLVMLMRGEIYTIDGERVFAFGGGETLERETSTTPEGKLPSREEIENSISNLSKYNNAVDYIVTHDAPSKLKLFINMESNELDNLNAFLEDIARQVKFKRWFFGKYHMDKLIPPHYQMVFTEVLKVK